MLLGVLTITASFFFSAALGVVNVELAAVVRFNPSNEENYVIAWGDTAPGAVFQLDYGHDPWGSPYYSVFADDGAWAILSAGPNQSVGDTDDLVIPKEDCAVVVLLRDIRHWLMLLGLALVWLAIPCSQVSAGAGMLNDLFTSVLLASPLTLLFWCVLVGRVGGTLNLLSKQYPALASSTGLLATSSLLLLVTLLVILVRPHTSRKPKGHE